MKKVFALFLIVLTLSGAAPAAKDKRNYDYRKVKVLVSTYYADRWSDEGRYRMVSHHGKRLGNFVALNFLPGGSIIMLPRIFKTTKFEVADTFGGTGYRYYNGRKYWKVDILRNRGEKYASVDGPVEMVVVSINFKGPVKNAAVRKNAELFIKSIK
ncbi:MAG TPA: hypothetical protein VMD02_07570 [Candidatus Omnitrophota bacterium]|nr:hypothetical protein [Candidatus Omnitrophota bacterium]